MSISVVGAIFSILTFIVKIFSFFTGKKEPSKIQKFLDRKKYERANRNKVSDDLDQGKSTSVDVIRKEQQEKIDQLRKTGMWLILCCFILMGCQTSTQKPAETLSPTTLKSTEKTYSIRTPTTISISTNDVYTTNDVYALATSIITNDQKDVIQLEGRWYAVHQNILRDMDENQRLLIQTLTTKNWLERGFLVSIGALIVCLILLKGKRKQ